MTHPCKAGIAASKIITQTCCRSGQARHGAFLPQTIGRPRIVAMLIKVSDDPKDATVTDTTFVTRANSAIVKNFDE